MTVFCCSIVPTERDDDVLLRGDIDVVRVAVGMPQLVIFERGNLVPGQVPDGDGILSEGQEKLVLVKEDECRRSLETALRDPDNVAGTHVNNLQVLVLLLDQQLFVELLDKIDLLEPIVRPLIVDPLPERGRGFSDFRNSGLR